MKRIGVIGAGAWGTALAVVVGRAGRAVTMWAHVAEVVADINRNHRNEALLPGVTLEPSIRATADLAEAGFRAYSGESAATSGYTLTAIAGATTTIATSFILTAEPSNWDDTTGCGNLTINQSGTRGVSGGAYTLAQCW